MGGEILKVYWAVHFQHFKPLFNEFVDYFTQIRQSSNFGNLIGKKIINSLTGRFGMSPNNETSFLIQRHELPTYLQRYHVLSFKYLNDIVLINIQIDHFYKKKISDHESNIALAAAITAKARIKLYRGFLDVQKNGGRVLYCDTDSIFAGFKNRVDNQRHGEIF